MSEQHDHGPYGILAQVQKLGDQVSELRVTVGRLNEFRKYITTEQSELKEQYDEDNKEIRLLISSLRDIDIRELIGLVNKKVTRNELNALQRDIIDPIRVQVANLTKFQIRMALIGTILLTVGSASVTAIVNLLIKHWLGF